MNWFTEISEKSRGHREARAANNIIDFGIGSLRSPRSHGGHREDTIIIIIFNAEDAEKNKGRPPNKTADLRLESIEII